MEIRRAQPEDAQGVRRVAEASWHTAYDEILGEETIDTMLDEWYEVESIKSGIERDVAPMFVCIDDGTIVGFAQGVASDEPHADSLLSRIYVHPDEWGGGYGSRLLEELFDELSQAGHEDIWLTVLKENEVGRQFYEKHGFERIEEQTTQIGDQAAEELILVADLK